MLLILVTVVVLVDELAPDLFLVTDDLLNGSRMPDVVVPRFVHQRLLDLVHISRFIEGVLLLEVSRPPLERYFLLAFVVEELWKASLAIS